MKKGTGLFFEVSAELPDSGSGCHPGPKIGKFLFALGWAMSMGDCFSPYKGVLEATRQTHETDHFKDHQP